MEAKLNHFKFALTVKKRHFMFYKHGDLYHCYERLNSHLSKRTTITRERFVSAYQLLQPQIAKS